MIRVRGYQDAEIGGPYPFVGQKRLHFIEILLCAELVDHRSYAVDEKA